MKTTTSQAKVTMSGQLLHSLDATIAAPEHHKVLLENDRVRVLDTRLGPGEPTPVHTHQWPAVLYIVSWSDFIRYDPEGNVLVDSRSMAINPAPGTSLWSEPLIPHYVHNVGEISLHVIAIEMKVS
jgi:quercetin dioxygenase-like cupin family protein